MVKARGVLGLGLNPRVPVPELLPCQKQIPRYTPFSKYQRLFQLVFLGNRSVFQGKYRSYLVGGRHDTLKAGIWSTIHIYIYI